MTREASTPIAIVGMGTKSGAGNSPKELWDTLRAARPAGRPITRLEVPAELEALACQNDEFTGADYLPKHEIRRMDRVHLFALASAIDAVEEAGTGPEAERTGVVVGVSSGAIEYLEAQYRTLLDRGPHRVSPLTTPITMVNSTAAHLSLHFGVKGPSHTFSTACASGSSAIGEGARLLRDDSVDRVIAGGTDAQIALSTLTFYWRMEAMSRNVADPDRACRPFDRDRDGFVMGEGSAFVVLERLDDAVAAGHDVLALVRGYGYGSDAHHLVAPCDDGDGARRCMEHALRDAGADTSDVAHINAHGTATPRNDIAEARGIRALFGDVPPPVTATKSVTGHLLGGSGAVETVASVRSLHAGEIHPVAGYETPDPEVALDVVAGAPRPAGAGAVLSNSFGFGGHNASLLISAP